MIKKDNALRERENNRNFLENKRNNKGPEDQPLSALTSVSATSSTSSVVEILNYDENKTMIRQVSASRDHTECNEETNNLVIDPDPAKWPEIIMDKDRVFLVKRGPPPALTNFRFPLDKNGRKFTSFNFNRVLSNGESVKRNWLIYSTSKNILFCFCCKLFAHSNKTNLSNEGFNNWKHTGVTLKKHELSIAHMLAQKS